MTEKQEQIINNLIAAMPEDDRKTYREIAEYAVSLGYTPKAIGKTGGAFDGAIFSKSKTNRTIIKILPQYNEVIDKSGIPMLSVKFFAAPEYSEIFSQGIKRVIEAADGKYTGCYTVVKDATVLADIPMHIPTEEKYSDADRN